MKQSLRRLCSLIAVLLAPMFIIPPAYATSLDGTEFTTYDYPDWGITLAVPGNWLYQEGQLPPSVDRPFKPSSGILSSRDNFKIGTWTFDRQDNSPIIDLSAFYTSAGTVERVETKKDEMMQIMVERFSTDDIPYKKGEFEIITCGDYRAACFSMTFTYSDIEYEHWFFCLIFPMTVIDLQGVAPLNGQVDIKHLLGDIAATIRCN